MIWIVAWCSFDRDDWFHRCNDLSSKKFPFLWQSIAYVLQRYPYIICGSCSICGCVVEMVNVATIHPHKLGRRDGIVLFFLDVLFLVELSAFHGQEEVINVWMV